MQDIGFDDTGELVEVPEPPISFEKGSSENMIEWFQRITGGLNLDAGQRQCANNAFMNALSIEDFKRLTGGNFSQSQQFAIEQAFMRITEWLQFAPNPRSGS